MPPKQQAATQRFCATVNHWTPEQKEKLIKFYEEHCSYGVWGEEVGVSGTPHLQCFFITKKRVRFAQIHTLLGFKDLHLEVSKGTPEQAAEYCREDGIFQEYGKLPSVGGKDTQKRNYAEIILLAEEGDLKRIKLEHPSAYLKWHNTIEKIACAHRNLPALPDTTGLWITGPTGTGKSRFARAFEPYIKNCNKWWCGYRQEDIVLIEDIDKKTGEHLGQFIKVWCDHYAFRGENKGSSIMLRPKVIIITSNYLPHEIWPDTQMYEPIERRCTILKLDPVESCPDSPEHVQTCLALISSDAIRGHLQKALLSVSAPPCTEQDVSSSELLDLAAEAPSAAESSALAQFELSAADSLEDIADALLLDPDADLL